MCEKEESALTQATAVDTSLLGVESTYIKLNPKSHELFKRATQTLPGGNTRSTLFFEPFPFYIKNAKGCIIEDVDGNERIDFLNNYSSLILGHSPPVITAAISDQLNRLIAVGCPTESEVQLAEEICKRLPHSVEKIRFCNSGTEATLLAIRAARTYTGRDRICRVTLSYHGSHDLASVQNVSSTTNALNGLPTSVTSSVLFLPFNDINSSSAILTPNASSIAAIIIEPVLGSGGIVPAKQEYLKFLRTFCDTHSIVLIFDEVISFRLSHGGAQGLMGVYPDLTTLGKIIGGGFPVGAVGGKDKIMKVFDPRRTEASGDIGVVMHGGTYNANPITMTAGLITLKILTAEVYELLAKRTNYFCDELKRVFRKYRVYLQVNQIGSLFNINLSNPQTARLFHLAASNRGVYFAPRGFCCMSLAIDDSTIRDAVKKLELALTDVIACPNSNPTPPSAL